MSELKLCSYCKSVPQANTWTLHGITETRYFCPNPDCPHSVRTVRLEQWNTRPIEDDLRKRIAELEAAQRWIPVSERLPEVGKVVHVISMNYIEYFTKTELVYETAVLVEINGVKMFGFVNENSVWSSGDVTHWMYAVPLPEATE
jgi:hypothetical protein